MAWVESHQALQARTPVRSAVQSLPATKCPHAVRSGWGRVAKGVRTLTLNERNTPLRRSTGKRLRFEVFKRDYFTCRYCGAQPPEAVLVVDHVLPVARGGMHTLDNLITACETCNQGKAARLLGDAPPRTDADLLYMETQQEIAEIRRYQEALAAKERAIDGLVETKQQLWLKDSGLDWSPSDRLVKSLLRRYPPEVVANGITDVALKLASGYLSERGNNWIGYLNVVCRTFAAEDGDG